MIKRGYAYDDGDTGQIILYDVTFDPFDATFAGGTDADGLLF